MRQGARPEAVIPAPEVELRRVHVAAAFITWPNEWREVSRVAIARPDCRISLGLAQRRRESGKGTEEPTAPARSTANA